MAKTDNLTDFLKGLADKFRALLGTSDPLNPQEFEEKIQAVRDAAYSEGFSQGGPTGITAAAADVLAGKVYGSGGSAKATGTMPNAAGATLTTTSRSLENNYLVFKPPGAGYVDTSTKLRCSYFNVASTIGLTAAKLMKGYTVLGVAGTGVPLGAAIWHSGPQYGTANIAPQYTCGVVSSGTLPAGTYRFVSSWTPYNDQYNMTLYVGGAAKSTATASGGLGMSDNTFSISGSQSYYLRQSNTGVYMYGTAALIKIG